METAGRPHAGVNVGWRDWFKTAEPAPPEDDPRLGQLVWVADQDGWCGSFKGLAFVLEHENASYPPEALKHYAFDVLEDSEWLQAALADAIASAPGYLTPYREEMAELTYQELHFSLTPRGPALFATLGPGRDYRCWRLEFTDRKCEGIGFDS